MLYQISSECDNILFQKVVFIWKPKKQTIKLRDKSFFYKTLISNTVGVRLTNTKINISVRHSHYIYFLRKFDNHLTFFNLLNFNFLFLYNVRLMLLYIDNICRLSKLKTAELHYSTDTFTLTKNYVKLVKLI
jgi:hypothetical protein